MPVATDRFILDGNVLHSSMHTLNIGGFFVYLYGVDELTPSQALDTSVMFHVHGRTRTYHDAEEIAHQLLYSLRESGGTHKGLVIATLDNRNHGIRAIDNVAIQDWQGGNPKHAQDMISMIDGIVDDVKLIMNYLPSYVSFTPTEYIATGLSLGGHVTWNLLAEVEDIKKAIIIVGCPDLTGLMLNRLGGYTSTTEVPPNTPEWPHSVEELYAQRDKKVSNITGKEILILNGGIDTLVPDKYTKRWVENYAANNNVTYIVQDGFGHGLSYGMMSDFEKYVPHLLN
ncbi:Alpha/Beta hydrolase protein [Limtongia smithiae]|uniref:Alpha/Beta hydrolase protein n=1 Tax=Limtongia smithiae TaxID=1125753 RepID=UPI0034CE6EDB